jgi:L-ascorbate oxidase
MRHLPVLLLLAACSPKPEPAADADPVDSADTDTAPACFTLADGRCVEQTWVDLPELEPVDGVHTLTLAPTEIVIDGKRHCGRAYNGLYPGPTLVTPAREGDTPREVRVDLKNTLSDHDYRSLDGDETCACTDGSGEACLPAGHGGCDTEPSSEDCACLNDEGEACEHMYDFNLTNLHAHGAHVEPDAADGGGCVATADLDCRDCDEDACDGDPSDDTCFFADDVLTEVHPGTGARYRWDIDEDGTHHAGLD